MRSRGPSETGMGSNSCLAPAEPSPPDAGLPAGQRLAPQHGQEVPARAGGGVGGLYLLAGQTLISSSVPTAPQREFSLKQTRPVHTREQLCVSGPYDPSCQLQSMARVTPQGTWSQPTGHHCRDKGLGPNIPQGAVAKGQHWPAAAQRGRCPGA